ncbi:c-type cytochrome [Chloroflexota bacterium]
MIKHLWLIGLLFVIASGIFIGGCNSSNEPTPTSPSPAPTATPTPPAVREVAGVGENVFASRCAGCHGTTGGGGRGPAVIGSKASLGKYNTAQGLFDFVSTNMPKSNPGSLSHQDYLNVVSFLLVQNNYLQKDATFLESQLINITLK